ncbi:MAG: sulfatase-like hydrolase/transferase [Phycisphaerae bacterium]|nr:sulfatase-like hydrolase/transferase [Phycisphaerae bacterium]
MGTKNKKLGKIIIIAGVLLCIAPLIINQWTLEKFGFNYIGDGLSVHNTILLWTANLYSLTAGIILIRKKSAVPFRCILLWSTFLFIFIAPYLLYCFQSGDFGGIADLVYAELLGLTVYGIIILLLPQWGIVVSFIVQSLICAAQSFYIFYYETLPGESIFYVLFETNQEEARGYIFDYLFSLPILIPLGLWALLLWQFYKLARKTTKSHLRICVPILVLPLLVPLFHGKTRETILGNNFFVKCVSGYNNYNRLQRETREGLKLPLNQLDEVSFISPRPDKEIHVLVVGESADRDHMEIYGYHRQTTPLMESMGNDIYCFSNVICAYLNTIPNINALLTFENNDIYGKSAPKGTMIHYLKKAGYKTYWISNQNPIGRHETLTTILARNCDQALFVNLSDNRGYISYDQKLHDPFQKILEEDANRKFIFIHMMGQHSPYRVRYTSEYNIFKDPVPGKSQRQSSIINQYDNATVYNDFVISKMIELLRARQVYSSFIYLSDHGLEVYDSGDFHGHSFDGGLEIPFIVWLSKEYHHLHPDVDKRFRNILERPYTSDDTIHSVFDLLGVQFKSFDSTRSVFSPDFRHQERIIQKADHSRVKDYDAEKR